MDYLLHLVVYFEIFSVVAISLNLLVGYAGLLQIAHAAFFGIGAYTSALLWTRHGFGFFPGLCAAAIASCVLSVLVSVPAGRFKGDYFVMVSIAVQALLFGVFLNWTAVTGGPFGISGIPRPGTALPGQLPIVSIAVLYATIALALIFMMAFLQRSPFGRALRALRDDTLAARSIGLPTDMLKLQAFAIACAMAGLAGSMYAAYVSFIDPSSFSLSESILMLSMVVIGGTGNLRGPLVGALVLVLLPEGLRFLRLPDTVAADIRMLIYGLGLVVMMRLRPQGLLGRYRYR